MYVVMASVASNVNWKDDFVSLRTANPSSIKYVICKVEAGGRNSSARMLDGCRSEARPTPDQCKAGVGG